MHIASVGLNFRAVGDMKNKIFDNMTMWRLAYVGVYVAAHVVFNFLFFFFNFMFILNTINSQYFGPLFIKGHVAATHDLLQSSPLNRE